MASSIMGLLNEIENEEIVLPAIQRDFVWSEDKTATLLDSVVRGYPLGIVLLWETYNDIQYRPFSKDFRSGTVHTYSENGRRKRLKVVLDGQQRLQTLFIALRGQRDGRAVYFDVLSGEAVDDTAESRFRFEFLDEADVDGRNVELNASDQEAGDSVSEDEPTDPPAWWVRVQDLFAMGVNERQAFVRERTRALQLSDSASGRLEKNLSLFRERLTADQDILLDSTIDKNLPRENPDRKSEADVLEIFVRVNREGTPLSRSDLIFSLLKLNWREAAEGLPEFVASVNEGNSLALDTDFVVRCLFAVSELGGRLQLDVLRNQRNVAALQGNFEQCSRAIRATVDFLKTECKIESSKLLGNSSTLVPIVYYIFNLPRHDVPNAETDRLRTAIYVLGLAKPFSRYSEGRIGAFVRQELQPLAAENDRSFPLEATLEWTADWEGIDSIRGLASKNTDLTLHLIQGLSGAKVQYEGNAPEVDHIFPRSELRKKKYKDPEINDFANFWTLARGKNRNKSNRPPKTYFKDVSDQQLKRALIRRDLLTYGRYRTFLRTREEAILKKLKGKLELSDADFQWEDEE